MGGKLANDLGFVAHDHISFHQVFQFADIAWPGVLHDAAHSVIAELGRMLAVLLAVFGEKEIQKNRNLFAALTQRRYMDADHVEPVEEVFTKHSFLYGPFQGLVGGRQYPHVDLDITLASETRKLVVLENVQKLGLQGRMHFADL